MDEYECLNPRARKCLSARAWRGRWCRRRLPKRRKKATTRASRHHSSIASTPRGRVLEVAHASKESRSNELIDRLCSLVTRTATQGKGSARNRSVRVTGEDEILGHLPRHRLARRLSSSCCRFTRKWRRRGECKKILYLCESERVAENLYLDYYCVVLSLIL